jgi:hypothetical protein
VRATAIVFAVGVLLAASALAAEDQPTPDVSVKPHKPAAAEPPGQASAAEVVPELDPYYTDIDYNVPLTDKPIPTITSDDEKVIYRDLIRGSLVPRYMVLEASVYPLPILGTYLKSHTPGLYRMGQIASTGVNVIDSATAGFQEPFAISAFFGNVARLERPGERRAGTNYGYTGYLISAGSRHIKDNVLIFDNWYELEWKIKGKLDYPDEKMDWSFRVGVKNHSNPDIVDVMYLSARRNNMGFRFPFLSWMQNSDFDIKLNFSQHGGRVVRQEYVVGKKYPVAELGVTPTLDFGLIWASPDEYSGVLRTRNTSSWTLVFRPSVEF